MLESKLGLYHVVLTTAKTCPEKITLTVVEMQQLPDIAKDWFHRINISPKKDTI